jgi:hypothetical protein
MRIALVCACILLLAVGCAMGPDLEPAPGANRVADLKTRRSPRLPASAPWSGRMPGRECRK